MRIFRFGWLNVVFLLFLIEVVVAQEGTKGEWKLEKDQNGIKVFTRKVTGFKLKEFKAFTTIAATPDELLDIIRAVDRYYEWMENMAHSEVLKKISDDEIYIYAESRVPWPFSNRDVVTYSVLYWEGEKAIVDMTGVSNFIPEKKGIVRLPFSKGLWVFNPVNDKETEIIYQYQGDPGGKIPGWVANIFIVDGPYKTLLGMKEYLLKLQEN